MIANYSVVMVSLSKILNEMTLNGCESGTN